MWRIWRLQNNSEDNSLYPIGPRNPADKDGDKQKDTRYGHYIILDSADMYDKRPDHGAYQEGGSPEAGLGDEDQYAGRDLDYNHRARRAASEKQRKDAPAKTEKGEQTTNSLTKTV